MDILKSPDVNDHSSCLGTVGSVQTVPQSGKDIGKGAQGTLPCLRGSKMLGERYAFYFQHAKERQLSYLSTRLSILSLFFVLHPLKS